MVVTLFSKCIDPFLKFSLSKIEEKLKTEEKDVDESEGFEGVHSPYSDPSIKGGLKEAGRTFPSSSPFSVLEKPSNAGINKGSKSRHGQGEWIGLYMYQSH